jgi:hypothetical protein
MSGEFIYFVGIFLFAIIVTIFIYETVRSRYMQKRDVRNDIGLVKKEKVTIDKQHVHCSEYIILPSPESIYENAAEHGWYDSVNRENPHRDFFPAQIALIHAELSEALEEYRKMGLPAKDATGAIETVPITEELADAVLRIFSLVGFLRIERFDKAISAKHNYNKERPYRHGNKIV